MCQRDKNRDRSGTRGAEVRDTERDGKQQRGGETDANGRNCHWREGQRQRVTKQGKERKRKEVRKRQSQVATEGGGERLSEGREGKTAAEGDKPRAESRPHTVGRGPHSREAGRG